jgi:hypothetical protein
MKQSTAQTALLLTNISYPGSSLCRIFLEMRVFGFMLSGQKRSLRGFIGAKPVREAHRSTTPEPSRNVVNAEILLELESSGAP